LLQMRISRSTGAVSGFAIILLAVWGGIIPFIGPYFHYSFGSNATWHYTSNRFWLDIAPAIVAIVGGLLMIRSGHRVSGVVGCWLALAAGAWFVLGPPISLMWEHSSGPIGAPMYGPTRQAIELVGYFYGVGALIMTFAAFALGRFVTRPATVIAAPTASEPIAGEPVAGEPVATREPVADRTPVTEPEPVADRAPVVAAAPADSTAPATAGGARVANQRSVVDDL
jgi:hypothetical protein